LRILVMAWVGIYLRSICSRAPS